MSFFKKAAAAAAAAAAEEEEEEEASIALASFDGINTLTVVDFRLSVV